MIYTEVEKKELDEVQRVFAEHLRQCPDYELLWSDITALPSSNKELQQQELNQQDMELVKQIDALQRSTDEEDGKKLEELYQQREKLWK